MGLFNHLVLASLALLPSCVLANHAFVEIDFFEPEEEVAGPVRHLRVESTANTIEQRFLEDVVNYNTTLEYGSHGEVVNHNATCWVCEKPWVCNFAPQWAGSRRFFDPLVNGTICGMKLQVYGICGGIETGVLVKLNGNALGSTQGTVVLREGCDASAECDSELPGHNCCNLCGCDQCNTGSELVLTESQLAWYNMNANNTINLSSSDPICISHVDVEVESCHTESNGDPHFRTWKNEHFEFHGQCDLVMTKVQDFAGEGMDLDIHLRTSMVRYWSYIKSAAIRIGNDILEVEGSATQEDGEIQRHYRINYEYLGPLETLGGFPVTISPRNNLYTIDLDSKFPGQKIEIKTFKEFVGVKIIGANAESFGNAVGITGNFHTGKTVARDGHSVINNFNELGLEWQVLPSDGKLFHDSQKPQFPEKCYLPEDPRGERARRLAESSVTEEQAEAACAGLKDEFDRKGCVYDILATQDMDMVGAY